MPQPLDYRNPKAQTNPARAQPEAVVAIPVEFDVVLTRTNDHPAARAIEAALRREKIPFHVSHDGKPAGRTFEVHIRAQDQDPARQIAGKVFTTRQKIKAIPKIEVPKDEPSLPQHPVGTLFWLLP